MGVDLQGVVVNGRILKEAKIGVEDLSGQKAEPFSRHPSVVKTRFSRKGYPESVAKALNIMSVYSADGVIGVDPNIFSLHCDLKLVPVRSMVKLSQGPHENLMLVLVVLRIFHLKGRIDRV